MDRVQTQSSQKALWDLIYTSTDASFPYRKLIHELSLIRTNCIKTAIPFTQSQTPVSSTTYIDVKYTFLQCISLIRAMDLYAFSTEDLQCIWDEHGPVMFRTSSVDLAIQYDTLFMSLIDTYRSQRNTWSTAEDIPITLRKECIAFAVAGMSYIVGFINKYRNTHDTLRHTKMKTFYDILAECISPSGVSHHTSCHQMHTTISCL